MDKSSTEPERIVPHALLMQQLRDVYAPFVFSQSCLVRAFDVLDTRKNFNLGDRVKVREDAPGGSGRGNQWSAPFLGCVWGCCHHGEV